MKYSSLKRLHRFNEDRKETEVQLNPGTLEFLLSLSDMSTTVVVTNTKLEDKETLEHDDFG